MKVLKIYSNSTVDKFKSAVNEHNLQPKLSDFDKFRFDGLVVRDMSINNVYDIDIMEVFRVETGINSQT